MKQRNYTPINDLIKKLKEKEKISYLNKEIEPITKKEIKFQEIKELEIKDEIKPHITKREETIKIPQDIQKLGLKPIPTFYFPQYENVKLPLSDDKIITGLHAPVYSSLRWLATLAMYILQKTHLSLKVIHGKVVRVLKK